MKFLLYLAAISSLVFAQDERITYHVDGTVLLEGSDNHQGVEISFYNLLDNPPSLTDSTFSDATGYYELDIVPGWYQVIWTNDGYIPWILGSLTLGADMEI